MRMKIRFIHEQIFNIPEDVEQKIIDYAEKHTDPYDRWHERMERAFCDLYFDPEKVSEDPIYFWEIE